MTRLAFEFILLLFEQYNLTIFNHRGHGELLEGHRVFLTLCSSVHSLCALCLR
jgi:hypothetical protein